MTLNGKRIILLGGSSGIGLATAQAAAKEGAQIVIASSRQASLDKALAALPAGTTGHALDLADEAQIRSLFETLGAFDHLVFTAGENLRLGNLADTDIAQAQRFWKVRYWGAFMAAKYGSPHIRPGGSITFTSGLAGQRPHPGWSVASSICGAMEGLTRALAVELAPIRVNAVSPGVVKTPLWDSMNVADRDALYRQMDEALLVGHAGESDEIAQAYIYLMRQTYGTGHVLLADGGGALI
jgi:NAD(P)-dependent dehydrogenase (short-subunit alcohol dehydrogenase family)